MISTQVFFTIVKGNTNVKPPFIDGHKNSFWITTRTANEKQIMEVAEKMAATGFGMVIKDLELCNQFGEEER